MKKNLLLIAAIFLMATKLMATTHTVSVGGMSFIPATLTVHPGDVIVWTWSNGGHTTTSTSVPSGAVTWNSPINSTATSFSYTATTLGTYQYQCNFHVSMGMTGTITVVSATGVAPVNANPVFRMYPNPVRGALHLEFNDPIVPVSVTMRSLTGQEIISKQYSGTMQADLNTRDLPNGLYFISAIQGDRVYQQQVTVMH
jgi:plastocyanin